MIDEIAHIAIAVPSLDEALPFYRDVLGLTLDGIEEVPSQKVRVALLRVGHSHFELLEPTAPDSPISKFLQTRGPGLHHVALATTDLATRLQALQDRSVPLIDKVPRVGAEGKEVAFLHPKASGGVLFELCAAPAEGAQP
jgi:methylmalonyl-CoA/ethylmalonyl-CoA epimerase